MAKEYFDTCDYCDISFYKCSFCGSSFKPGQKIICCEEEQEHLCVDCYEDFYGEYNESG
jgi:hypothetical protein